MGVGRSLNLTEEILPKYFKELSFPGLVEAGGIEPPSERFQLKASTCLSSDLNLISTNSQKQDQVETSS